MRQALGDTKELFLVQMTWYASHIYFVPTGPVLAALAAERPLRDGIFIVDPLRNVKRDPSENEHGMGPKRLGVIRELVSTETGDHAAEWFGSDALSWDPYLTLPETKQPQLISEARAFVGLEDEGYFDCVPPAELRVRLKAISEDTGTPLAYYFHFMWGGETEIEVAWCFQSTIGSASMAATTKLESS